MSGITVWSREPEAIVSGGLLLNEGADDARPHQLIPSGAVAECLVFVERTRKIGLQLVGYASTPDPETVCCVYDQRVLRCIENIADSVSKTQSGSSVWGLSEE